LGFQFLSQQKFGVEANKPGLLVSLLAFSCQSFCVTCFADLESNQRLRSTRLVTVWFPISGGWPTALAVYVYASCQTSPRKQQIYYDGVSLGYSARHMQ